MAKKQPQSELYELLKLLRRIIVLAVAAFGLMRGMPYATLAVRLAILWAILYISSGLVDVVFRHLSYRSALRSISTEPLSEEAAVKAVQKAK